MAMLTLSVIAGDVNAQGYGLLIERGAGVNFGGASQENVNQFGGGAGYVVNRYVELGVAAGRSMDDAAKVNATAVGPFVGFYPVRMSPSFPVSVRLGAGYNRLLFGGETVDALGNLPPEMGGPMEMSGSKIAGSGSLFLGLPISSTLYFVPLGEFGYEHTEIDMKNSAGTATDNQNTTYVTAGASLVVMASPSTRFALTPAVTFRDGDRQFGISAMMVLPQ